jgi:hypothetical protein
MKAYGRNGLQASTLYEGSSRLCLTVHEACPSLRCIHRRNMDTLLRRPPLADRLYLRRPPFADRLYLRNAHTRRAYSRSCLYLLSIYLLSANLRSARLRNAYLQSAHDHRGSQLMPALLVSDQQLVLGLSVAIRHMNIRGNCASRSLHPLLMTYSISPRSGFQEFPARHSHCHYLTLLQH